MSMIIFIAARFTSAKCFSGDVRHQTALQRILANWLLLCLAMSCKQGSRNRSPRFSNQ